MEQNEISQFESLETGLTEESKAFLKETGKWAYFISIVGFIGIGFMILASLFASTLMSGFGQTGIAPSLITGIYLAMAGVYFLPIYYLFNFGNNVKKGFSENDSDKLEIAFKNLKSHYKFIGVLMLIFIGIYILGILGTILAAIF